ncbi:hypothetical protein QVD99_008038 [Batrachochytrium dendrobatidis]|nr:hypothetical protein O5D80_004808 [Batrachochytrium dendrobatidis]KAK5665192.1 hypothetical protein QVD99_008038 [Batrachochytrium dendrobatidis]
MGKRTVKKVSTEEAPLTVSPISAESNSDKPHINHSSFPTTKTLLLAAAHPSSSPIVSQVTTPNDSSDIISNSGSIPESKYYYRSDESLLKRNKSGKDKLAMASPFTTNSEATTVVSGTYECDDASSMTLQTHTCPNEPGPAISDLAKSSLAINQELFIAQTASRQSAEPTVTSPIINRNQSQMDLQSLQTTDKICEPVCDESVDYKTDTDSITDNNETLNPTQPGSPVSLLPDNDAVLETTDDPDCIAKTKSEDAEFTSADTSLSLDPETESVSPAEPVILAQLSRPSPAEASLTPPTQKRPKTAISAISANAANTHLINSLTDFSGYTTAMNQVIAFAEPLQRNLRAHPFIYSPIVFCALLIVAPFCFIFGPMVIFLVVVYHFLPAFTKAVFT